MTAGTSHTWLAELARHAASGPVVRAVVIDTKGSTPREVGAAMIVTADAAIGTIGGGALEHDIIAKARTLLAANTTTPWQRETHTYHLGPELNQCCGGAVTILLERFGPPEHVSLLPLAHVPAGMLMQRPLRSGIALGLAASAVAEPGLIHRDGQDWFCEPLAAPLQPVVIYGAGHVARALVKALADLPFAVTWVDTEQSRFPADPPGHPRLLAGDPIAAAATMPASAVHLVMTHSHALDEAIVTAILRQDRFAYLGLIGSDTKRARFRQRLERAGLPSSVIDRLICPIGLPGLEGKAPAVIAASVTASLLMLRPESPVPQDATQIAD